MLVATSRLQRLRFLVEQAELLGLARSAALRVAGVDEADLADPEARVPTVKVLRLWRWLAQQRPDPDLGLRLGERVRLEDAGALAYAMRHSADLASALRRLVRYAHIVDQTAELRLAEERAGWRLASAVPPLVPGFRPPIDHGLAGLLGVLRQLTAADLQPLEICWPYANPRSLAAHRRLFRGRLRFGEPRSAVLFAHSDVFRPLPAADPGLTGHLDRLLEIEWRHLPHDPSATAAARRELWRRLSEGPPRLEEVAAALDASPRTLQRRLGEEGTSFGRLVENVRREMAALLLADPRLPVREIGYLLGYTDLSSFHRAFRRWHGHGPQAHRRSRRGTAKASSP